MAYSWDIIPTEAANAMIDAKDAAILRILQGDAAVSIDAIAAKVHLSRNACWRRVKKMEDEGVIRGRVVLLDPAKLNLALTAFIAVKTARHEPQWLEKFAAAVKGLPEIIAVYRTTGDTDYMLQAVVTDIAGYDRLYKRLIAKIPLTDVSSSFVMEKIKETTALPLDYVN